MKIVFFSIPLFGHVNYGLKLAKALCDNKHKVRYYSGKAYERFINDKGVDFYAYNESIEELFSETNSSYSAEYMLSVEPEDVDYVSEIYKYSYHLHEIERSFIEQQRGEIEAFDPDIIVYDSAAIWGKRIARLLNIPCICSCTPYSYPKELIYKDPEMFSSLVFHQKMSGDFTLKTLKKMNALLKKKFLLSDEMPISENWCGEGDLNLLYTVKDFQLGSRFFNEDKNVFCGILIDKDDKSDVSKFVSNNGRKLVYISFGTIYNSFRLLSETAETLKPLRDFDFILNIGAHNHYKLFEGLPKNWKVVRRVPQISLLEKVDVFISHGGVNSVREAAHYGVPMVIVPWEGDTLCAAQDIINGNYGKAIDPSEIYRLKNVLVDVVNDSAIKDNCTELSQKMKNAGGLVYAVKMIEKIGEVGKQYE